MSSTLSMLSDENDPEEVISSSSKVKRLPRSAKKRLRYEQLREHRQQNGKKKNKKKSSMCSYERRPVYVVAVQNDSII
jgi:hypothetical protein